MQDYFSPTYYEHHQKKVKANKYKTNLLHLGLFLLTFITTTFAGAFWTTGQIGPYTFDLLAEGLPYSISILFIISCHEFGHYFAARYHKVETTLPFFIPFPPLPYFLNFGTMGAVIRTKSPVFSKKVMFDIGAAGPIAGFIACLIVLMYGFLNVPGEQYILNIHPDYFAADYGKDAMGLAFGDNLLFIFMKWVFINPADFFPPMSEIYHYPFLCVGWFGLFITSMNMIPVGQLDGGHISYALFGDKKSYSVASIAFIFLLVSGVLGFADAFMLQINLNFVWSGWLFWALILYFVIKIKHPPINDSTELDSVRKFFGYISFIIFIISFSPAPIYGV